MTLRIVKDNVSSIEQYSIEFEGRLAVIDHQSVIGRDHGEPRRIPYWRLISGRGSRRILDEEVRGSRGRG
jgi:hypothetical protein